MNAPVLSAGRLHRPVLAVFFVLLVAAVWLALPAKAGAVPSSIFPAPYNTEPQNPNNSFAIVTSGDGANVTLHAPIAQFKVFYPASDNATRPIVVNYGCANPGNDVMNTQITAQIAGLINGTWTPYDTKDNTSGCTGGDINFTVTTGVIPPQSDYYSPDYKVVLLTVTKTGGTGIKNFRVYAPGGQVTFAESDRFSTASPGQIGPVFSIWDGVDPSRNSERWYRFRFRVDCMYRKQTGASHFWLKWYDADYGAQNEGGNAIYFEIRNETTGQVHTVGSDQIGGDGVFGQVQIPFVNDNDQFTWTWYNVDRVNGIQVYMPFSEMQDQVSADCSWANPDKPATGWLDNVDCQAGAINTAINGWALDIDRPGDAIQVHLYFDGTAPHNFGTAFNTNVVRPDVNQAMGVGGVHGFSVPVPDRYRDDNSHTVYAFAIGLKPDGTPSGANPMLNGSPIRFGPCPPDKLPTGQMSANCLTISGWASDGDYNGSIRVNISIDGTLVAAGVLANQGGPQGARHFSVPYPDRYVDSRAHTITAEALGVNPAGQQNGRNQSIGSVSVGPCLQAECTVVFGTAIIGEDFDVTVTVRNTGGIAWDTGRYKVGVTNFNTPDRFNDFWRPLSPVPPTNGANRVDLPAAVNPGESRTTTFKARAPSPNTGFYDFGMRMVRQDRPEWFGGVCGRPDLPVNGRFKLVPFAQPPQAEPDPEAPTTIVFNTGINPESPTSASGANARATREFFWKRGGVVQGSLTGVTTSQANPHNARFHVQNYTDRLAFDVAAYRAGDEFCVRIRIEPAEGIADPNGALVGEPSIPMAETDGNACFMLANRPYLKAYGNDVWAGGGFEYEGSCDTNNKTIKTFARQVSPGDFRGSSVEFAAFAMDVIDGSGQLNGFYSASQRTAAPRPPTGLTFSNATGAGPWGGMFAASTRCITDFYSVTQQPAVPFYVGGRLNPAAVTGQRIANVSPGRLIIEGVSGLAGRRTIYVTGDVFIENNITYSDGNWNTTDDIPAFAVIVRGGNIYVSQNVTQLDGLFIAQPDGGASTGQIFTCVHSNGTRFSMLNAADRTTYFKPHTEGGCGSQLRVNGALVANRVHFLRSSNSLRDAGNPDTIHDNRAAEVISSSPEMYIAEPEFRPVDTGHLPTALRDIYDSIISLPPVY